MTTQLDRIELMLMELTQQAKSDLADIPLARVVLEMIEKDNHYWGTRPCETCQNASAFLDRDFGCVKKAREAAQAKRQ